MFSSYWYENIDAYNELYFPYDPNADYTVEAYPVLNLTYRHPIGDTYQDYYDYAQWVSGDPVYYPYYFGFTGPGPEAEISASSLLLGAVYSFFTGGAPVGPPDHVKVLSDTGQSERDRDCGFPDRRIRVEIVDSQGRRAVALLSTVPIRERFFSTGFPTSDIRGQLAVTVDHALTTISQRGATSETSRSSRTKLIALIGGGTRHGYSVYSRNRERSTVSVFRV